MENNVDLLKSLGLPVFRDSSELARLTHFSPERINALAVRNSRFYRTISVPKRNGKSREINQPSKEIKAIQAWILKNVLHKLEPSSHATAFIRGKNLYNNVSPHYSNSFFVCLDLEDFFPSISFIRVFHIFRTIGYSKTNSWTLARLCTCGGSLPQGGVTSPAISNIVAAKLDRRLGGLSSKRKIIYTRYSDDMIFSSRRPETLQKALPIIKLIIQSEGFTLNNNKTRFMGPYKRCTVTGLIRNSSTGEFSVGRRRKRLLRSIIHKTTTGNIGGAENFLDGWISFVNSINSGEAKKLKAYWNKLKKHNKVPG